MAWVKTDDRYADTKKVKKAWRLNRATVGLHILAKSHCAMHETDGLVDLEWLEERLPDEAERADVLRVMADVGLFEFLAAGEKSRVKVTRVKRGKPVDITVTYGPLAEDAYLIHDYLEFNESRQEAEERRRQDAERKTKARAKDTPASHNGLTAESDPRPPGRTADAAVSPLVPTRPDPTRPDQSLVPPNPPNGGRARDREKWERDMAAWVQANPADDAMAARWEGVHQQLRAAVDAPTFNLHLDRLHLHADGDSLIVGAPAGQIRWLQDRFGRIIDAAASKPVHLIECGCHALEAVA